MAVTPLAFLEMKIEIGFDAVESSKAALCEAPERLDAVDVSATLGEGFLFIDADMLVETDIDQAVIAGPTIGADDAGGIDPTPDDSSQRGLGAVLNDFCVDLAPSFEDAKDRLLESASAAQAWQRAASYPAGTEIAFIDLHDPLELAALHGSLQGNQKPKPGIQSIHGLPIELQKMRRLSGRQVQAKAFQDLFYPIFGQFAPLEHVAYGLP